MVFAVVADTDSGWGGLGQIFKNFGRVIVAYTLCLPALTSFAGPCDLAFGRLGNHLDAATGNLTFSLFSANAERVELSLYTRSFGAAPIAKVLLVADAGHPGYWRADLPPATRKELGLTEGEPLYYGYRLWGPNWRYNPKWKPGSASGFLSDVDSQGNRFNPNKLVYDPRALELTHDPVTPRFRDEMVYATGPINRRRNSGPVAPKGVVLNPPPSAPTAIHRPLREEIIYEAHLRGLTMNDGDIPAEERGTFKGAARKAQYLKELGVTAVEFLPLHAFQNETNRTETTEGNNYWGYMSNSFFALNGRFATTASRATPGGTLEEFRQMVAAFHKQGIKVIMDVVYNHTGEAGAGGAKGEITRLLSMRGIDNTTYYQVADDARYFKENTGCGANLNCANPHVRQFILDSLSFFKEMGVDGFRFDLAPVLGNVHERGNVFYFDRGPVDNVLNRALAELPGRPYDGGAGVDLIAEPWAIGEGTRQIGGFPIHHETNVGWAEWNGHGFRDPVRTSQNKLGILPVTPGEIAHALAGSQDVFGPSGRQPGHSVNFNVAHDGHTNADLYKYNEKQNNQKGHFGPSDGGEDSNLSWDQKLPGDTPKQTATRQRQAAANGMALPILSFGVPMFSAGDEMLRTQRGNNNMYNVDSPGSWLDWRQLQTEAGFVEYTKRLIAFRKAHPIFSAGKYFTGDLQPSGLRDISWHRADGHYADRDLPPRESGYMDDPSQTFIAFRVDTAGTNDSSRSVYVAYNYGSAARNVQLPAPAAGKKWFWAGDTASYYEPTHRFAKVGEEKLIHPAEPTGLGTYLMDSRAIAVFVEK